MALAFSSDEFDPSRYADDTLSCAESAKLPHAMARDHWTFGAGLVVFDYSLIIHHHLLRSGEGYVLV